jgi:hypothetical protein
VARRLLAAGVVPADQLLHLESWLTAIAAIRERGLAEELAA